MERRNLLKSAVLGLVGLVVPVKALAEEKLPVLEWQKTKVQDSWYVDSGVGFHEIEYACLDENRIYCSMHDDEKTQKVFGRIRFNSGVERPIVYVTISQDFDSVEQAKIEIPKIISRNLWRLEKSV